MPGNPKAIVADAERRFPIRLLVKVPPGGIRTRYVPMVEWLDEHCRVDGWSITPAGTRGLLNDALAVYVNTPACALAFVERWRYNRPRRVSIFRLAWPALAGSLEKSRSPSGPAFCRSSNTPTGSFESLPWLCPPLRASPVARL
jgi:hypothetical protein